MGMVHPVIAVDLGGTNLRCAVVDGDGAVISRATAATPAEAGPEAVLDLLVGMMDAAAAGAGLSGQAPAGLAMPGPLDPRRQIVAKMPNLAGWREFPVGDALRRRTDRPFALGNDGNCAALGEAAFGAARGVEDLVHLALGTGIGGGVISGGRLIDGARGYGAEVGHVVVATDGPRCSCGAVGCVESFAAGWALARDADLVARTDDGAAIRAACTGGTATVAALIAAAEAGDGAALAILDRAGQAVGAALGGFLNLFNPEMVTIGGGVGERAWDLLLPTLRRSLASHSFSQCRENLRIERSELGDDAGLLGAAALARQAPR
ncbi:MAG: ROK family protein [Chloroflexota bacterium]